MQIIDKVCIPMKNQSTMESTLYGNYRPLTLLRYLGNINVTADAKKYNDKFKQFCLTNKNDGNSVLNNVSKTITYELL